MADIEDYIGQSFGPFEILAHNASGAEAEVYLCGDHRTNMTYILRLDPHEDSMWDGDPVIPPINGSIECPNAKGGWHASDMYRSSVTIDDQTIEFRAVAMYGVSSGNRLVPVASQYRVEGAWDVDRLLDAVSLDHLMMSELWELMTSQIAMEALEAIDDSAEVTNWRDRWKDIPGHKSVAYSIESYLQAGTLESSTQLKVVSLASSIEQIAPDIAVNVLFRLYAGIYHKILPMNEAIATLLCPHFRRNVASYDLGMLLTVYANLKSSKMLTFPEPSCYSVLDEFMGQLCEEPLDEYSDDPRIGRQDDQPDVERFTLFLQEVAASKPQFPKFQKG